MPISLRGAARAPQVARAARSVRLDVAGVLEIEPVTARRFILGKQGLWPGRRWRGKRGTETAMRAIEHLQLDPLNVVARSQDLVLHSRVVDYSPGLWQELAYEQRKFFEWGGWLAVRPMDELPHYRRLMQRESLDPRLQKHAQTYAAEIDQMRGLLAERETISNRELEAGGRAPVSSYRGRKESALALYHLWRMGEVMVHRRNGFERVYALASRVAPSALLRASEDEQADQFLIRKQLSFYGLWRFTGLGNLLKRKVSSAEAARWREQLIGDGQIVPVRVGSSRQTCYASAGDRRLLESLAQGRIPSAWKPLGTTTEAEAVFLSPFDVVSARGRARDLFDFDYVWEAYKPEARRRWGYFTMPILWGERLVARVDPKLDRTTSTLVLCGLWLEDEKTGRDLEFVDALCLGLWRLLDFLGAGRLDAAGVRSKALRAALERPRTRD